MKNILLEVLEMWWLPWVIISWFITAIICTGFIFRFYQKEFPGLADGDRLKDLGLAIFSGVFLGMIGPIGVMMVLLLTGFGQHGWCLWSKSAH